MTEHWESQYAQGGLLPWEIDYVPAEVARLADALEPASLILDVGCGRGDISRWLAESGMNVVGIDISGSAIAAARSATTPSMSCEFHVADVLDFEQSVRFDAVLDYSLFHHIKPLDRFPYLHALRRLVKAGGMFSVTTYSVEDLEGRDIATNVGKLGNRMYYTELSELVGLLEACGFDALVAEPTQLGPRHHHHANFVLAKATVV